MAQLWFWFKTLRKVTISKLKSLSLASSMMFSISNSKPLFLLLLLFLCQPFHGVTEDGSSRRPFESSNRAVHRQQPMPNCGELVLKSQCSQNSKCSWCTSQDLDDMCFSKSEALRLPHQVFSCGSIR